MKKLKTFGILSLIVCLLSAIWIYSIKSNTPIKVVQGSASYKTYDTIDDLEKGSHLIVIASTAQKLEQRKPIKAYMPNGALADFSTLTNINVKKILKQPENFKLDSKKNMDIHEPAVLLNDASGERLLTTESYSPLLENDEYVLFLKSNDNGEYFIINMYRGKFNLSKDENAYTPLSSYQDDYKSKYLEMKKEVSKKYSLKIKETN